MLRKLEARLGIDISPVMGADLGPQGIIASIGRDILSRFSMIYHGPGGRRSVNWGNAGRGFRKGFGSQA